MQKKTNEDLLAEVQELRTQLEEAQDTLDAIRRGEVDGLVVSTPADFSAAFHKNPLDTSLSEGFH